MALTNYCSYNATKELPLRPDGSRASPELEVLPFGFKDPVMLTEEPIGPDTARRFMTAVEQHAMTEVERDAIAEAEEALRIDAAGEGK